LGLAAALFATFLSAAKSQVVLLYDSPVAGVHSKRRWQAECVLNTFYLLSTSSFGF